MAAGGRRRADVQGSRGPTLLLLVAVVATLVTLGALLLWPQPVPDGPDARTPDRPTPSEAPHALDLSDLPLARSLDCRMIDDDAVAAALAAPVSTRDDYADGDRVSLAPGVTDVAHEYGCVFTAEAGSEAKVWVFAAPVGTADAQRHVREARTAPGCTAVRETAGFGSPHVTDVCTLRSPRRVVATLRGLFGDAWVSCQVTDRDDSAETVRARAERWCVHVATTLGAVP